MEHMKYLRRRRRRRRLVYGALIGVAAIALAAAGWLTAGAGGCLDRRDAQAETGGSAGWSEVPRCVMAELSSLLRSDGTTSESAAVITLARTDRGEEGPDGLDASAAGGVACEEADAGCEAEAIPPGSELSLPYAVLVGEYATLAEARSRREESGRIPMSLYIVPVGAGEAVRYRVFAGLLSDRLDAEELLSRLVYSGVKDSLAPDDIKHVRYAFSFGTFRLEAEARSVLRDLLAHDVPGYLVPAGAGAGRGGRAYHVYAGAFESPVESLPLRDAIRRAGLTAELVERTGVLAD